MAVMKRTDNFIRFSKRVILKIEYLLLVRVILARCGRKLNFFHLFIMHDIPIKIIYL